MNTTLQNIDHEAASLADLWHFATADMRAAAEDAASKAMAKLANPLCGAREIVIAQHLRSALKVERKSVEKFMAAFRK